jgi:hypothetical protein
VFFLFGFSVANASDDLNITKTLTVGSSDETSFFEEMYQKHPVSKEQLDNYRKKSSELPYGSTVEMHISIQDGNSEINWKEVTAGAVAGVGAAVLWNAFGGELLCFAGFVPACVCVGPQC